MKLALFQQICPVADSEGKVQCVFALDTNGDVWLRKFTSAFGWEDWEAWDMPEQEPPKDAWDTLLDAQERLRAEGRDVEVIEHGDLGEPPQRSGPQEGDIRQRPLRSDEITGTIADVRTRTQTYQDGQWVNDELGGGKASADEMEAMGLEDPGDPPQT